MSLTVVWGDDFVRLDPVKRTLLDQGRPETPPVRVRSGRNMHASFQLSVGPLAGNETARVRAGTLKTGGKSSIPSSQFDVYVEWFREVDGAWYPEICVPQRLTGGSTPDFRKKNNVPGAQYAGFWVDLFVPADARPGVYEGTVEVAAGSETLSVPVILEVAAVRLSHESCLDFSLNNYADGISKAWPELWNDRNHLRTAKYRRVEKGVFRTAHEHRGFLHYLPYGHSGDVRDTFAPPLAGEGHRRHVTSWADWDRHFGGYLDGSAFQGTRRGPHPVKRFWLPLNLCWPSDFLKFGQPGYQAEWQAVGRQMVDHVKEKGWTKTSFDMFPNHKQRFMFFPWDAEEARFVEDNELQYYLRTLWEGTFDRASTAPARFDYTFGTTWLFDQDVRSDLTEFIDVFIGGGMDVAYARSEIPRLLKKNRQLWPCLNSGNILQSVRAAAFPPLMVWMQDATGYMPYWSTMGGWGNRGWRDGSDKGSLAFLYCGAMLDSEETFASVRLKTQRNMLQAVDLFQSVADKSRGGKAAVKRKINQRLGIPADGWFPSRKPADDDTDRFTEEPPLAGWQQFEVEQYRAVQNMALTLAAGEKK